jgi:hypothetical protein
MTIEHDNNQNQELSGIPNDVVVNGHLSRPFIDELKSLEGQDLRDRFKEYYPDVYQYNLDKCGGVVNNNFPSDNSIRSTIAQNIMEAHVNKTMEETEIPQEFLDMVRDLK